MKKIPIILDGDPGHDDAVAWVLANALDCFEILAITTVAGNQTIEKTTLNALKICALLNLHVPVAKGATKPILSEPIIAPNFHGVSGLDGVSLPEPIFDVEPISAVDLMYQTLNQASEKVVLIATGPLTNVAELLIVHPEVKEKIRCISIMGGGIHKGNWTPAAEFNILEDPEAAATVFDSGVDIQMCGLDVTEDALVYPKDIQRIADLNNDVAIVVSKWIEFFIQYPLTLGYEGAPLHDPCAVLSLAYPEIFNIVDMNVAVELNGKFTRGCTVGNQIKNNEKVGNARVVMGLDRLKFIDIIVELLKTYDVKEGAVNE